MTYIHVVTLVSMGITNIFTKKSFFVVVSNHFRIKTRHKRSWNFVQRLNIHEIIHSLWWIATLFNTKILKISSLQRFTQDSQKKPIIRLVYLIWQTIYTHIHNVILNTIMQKHLEDRKKKSHLTNTNIYIGWQDEACAAYSPL